MKKTESGLYYKIIENGNGPQPQKGDIVKVHYTGTLLDGTKFDSSVDRGQPLPFKLGVGMVIKGWDEGIAMLHVGDSAKLVIPGELAYGERGAGQLIGPNETLVFHVKLEEIVNTGPFNIEGKEEKNTPSGLKYYIIEEHPDAPMPKPGQKVFVHYTGYLEDGTKFDSSWDRMQPFGFPLGQGRVIKGWDEGIGLLHKGEKARLIIPSHLGYGKQGAGGVIPPDATLIFDVELVDIK
ncbi:MAG: FKBP-type peptidyl-prolyl cis-trans isomerase [Bacteroidetes bacterium]|nr:MAG: FKBP-type peptidyl-prolyl cis-trans isomerase [Bacteroidota bacterium]